MDIALNMNISLSELDETRFGVVTAKANLDGQDNLANVTRWCVEKGVEFLIARIPVEDVYLVQDMESSGFFLTDTLIFYKNAQVNESPCNSPEGYSWRLATERDAGEVGILSEKIFNNYHGHYHADRKLNKSDCDSVYSSWAVNSCLNKNFCDAMIIIEFRTAIVGFLTVKTVGHEICEIVLNGVDPNFQNKGLYALLISLAKKWALERQLKAVIVSTQLNNLAVQKVWCRQGFEPYKSFYTFHKWFAK